METPESDAGLNLIKEKIVARLTEQGESVDINSEQVHRRAIQVRDELEKEAEEARKRLRKRFLKDSS